jgi:hypothetical protein
MAERWFSDDELERMSRPTMDRAIEALDRGDLGEGAAAPARTQARSRSQRTTRSSRLR